MPCFCRGKPTGERVADGPNVSHLGQSQSQGARYCAGPQSPRDLPAAHCLTSDIIAHKSRPIMSVQYTDRIAGTNTVIGRLADLRSTSVSLCWLIQLPSHVRTVIFC
jgi:hypothetical protein